MSSMSQRQLAQRVVRGHLPPGLPRPTHPVFHFGGLANVDVGRNVATFVWNEPGSPVAEGVPWVQYYTAANPPDPTDLAVGMQWDKDKFALMGRLVVPDASILLG